MFIPAARKVWMNRKDPHALKGVSIGMNILIVVNATLWFLYGYLTGAFWVAAPGFVNLPLAVITIFLVFRSRGEK